MLSRCRILCRLCVETNCHLLLVALSAQKTAKKETSRVRGCSSAVECFAFNEVEPEKLSSEQIDVGSFESLAPLQSLAPRIRLNSVHLALVWPVRVRFVVFFFKTRDARPIC